MKVKIENTGIINHCDVEFIPGLNLIIGSSGSGKSTLMRAIYSTAINDFNDSDISFNKNSMSITIENKGNIIKYSRAKKSNNDKSYYEVNGERFVKIGRVPLSNVNDVLKINDIEINNEKINFNFNLQFSSPFLILGSQSTLYNVLTYRSSFDIASINDYYNADVKNNNNEINANVKLKCKLNDSLVKLEEQASKLSSIEQIYSNYTNYKHKLNKLHEIESLLSLLRSSIKLSNKIKLSKVLLQDLSKSICTAENISLLHKYKENLSNLLLYNNKVTIYEELINHHKQAIDAVYNLNILNDYKDSLSQIYTLKCKCTIIDESSSQCDSILNKESFIFSVVKQLKYIKVCNACSNIVNLLNSTDNATINKIESMLNIKELILNYDEINKSFNAVLAKEDIISKELESFRVCPLCGKNLENHNFKHS